MEESAHQARGVINALLTFTRKGVTEKGPVDLGRVVSKTIKLLRRLLPASVVIVHEPPSEETWIYADATQIQQVIMNLALNARDAMPSGGKLSLSVGRQDTVAPPAGQGTADKSHTAALIVKDTGEGMSEEVRAKLFEPFFTTKPRGKGTGLGMAVVLGIVEDHKGRIEVESEPGKGTRVTVLLPLCAPLRKAPVARPPQQTGTHAQTPIILLEGDEHVQSIFASVLWSRGYEAVTTARLAEALAAIRAQPRKASVIIIDSDYLNEDGLRQVQAMGSESERFLMIELTSRPAGQELAGLPADRVVLRKPFLLADFLAAVDEIRERSGSE